MRRQRHFPFGFLFVLRSHEPPSSSLSHSLHLSSPAFTPTGDRFFNAKAAAAWVKTNITSFYFDTAIIAITVGDEVFTTLSSASPLLLPALESLHNALIASNLNSIVKNRFAIDAQSLSLICLYAKQRVAFERVSQQEPYATINNADAYNSSTQVNRVNEELNFV
ncbi:Glucan endo-1-3-beta-glucosidase 1 [Nymphaea thermarum]|nr:Glucan endo-1-3-beta-glucosidase 1 [Nymphaea thermarum]